MLPKRSTRLQDSIDRLRAAGVQLLYGPDVLELHEPGTGSQRVVPFPWQLTLEALDAIHVGTGLTLRAR